MTENESPIVSRYLDLMDAQREQVMSPLKGLSHDQLWQRPEPGEWCIGEILNHTVVLYQSIFPIVRFAWRHLRWTAKLFKSRQTRTDIEDPYRKPAFPHWSGFLWKPKYTPDDPVSLDRLVSDLQGMHQSIREFYEGKPEEKLGSVFVFDPLFGFLNLILALRIGIYHDRLHYEDVIEMADKM